MLQALLNSAKNPLSDRGIMNVNMPTPGTPDAGELWKSPVVNNPIAFSKAAEREFPGSTANVWKMYQEDRRLPIDGVLKMIRDHSK